jgi:hypothetical protein
MRGSFYRVKQSGLAAREFDPNFHGSAAHLISSDYCYPIRQLQKMMEDDPKYVNKTKGSNNKNNNTNNNNTTKLSVSSINLANDYIGSSAEGFYQFNDPFHTIRQRAQTKEQVLLQANIVLAVVTDVIRSQRSDLSSLSRESVAVNYLAALLTALQKAIKDIKLFPAAQNGKPIKAGLTIKQQLAQRAAEDDTLQPQLEFHENLINAEAAQTIEPILYLLSHLFHQIPASVLVSQHEFIATVFSELTQNFPENQRIIRYSLGCIAAQLIAVQSKHQIWLQKQTLNLFQALLVYSTDSRPKLRQSAQESVREMFSALYNAGGKNNLPKNIVELFLQFIQHQITNAGDARGDKELLHLNNLFQGILQFFSPAAAAKIFELLFTALPTDKKNHTVNNTILFVQTLRTIYCYFENYSEIEANYYAELIAVVVQRLSELRPHPQDSEASRAYFNAVNILFERLFTADPSNSFDLFLQYRTIWAFYLQSAENSVVKLTAITLTNIYSRLPFANDNATHEAIEFLQSLLNYKYSLHYPLIFPIITNLITNFPLMLFGSLIKLLKHLDALRSSARTNNLNISGLDEVFGALIMHWGIIPLLDNLSLNLPVDSKPNSTLEVPSSDQLRSILDNSRVWLLHLMKNYVRNSELSYFLTELKPLAEKLHSLMLIYAKNNQQTEAAGIMHIRDAIWATLPAFCYLPTDLADNYKDFAKQMCFIFGDNSFSFAHQHICKGFTILITKLREIPKDSVLTADTAADGGADSEELAELEADLIEGSDEEDEGSEEMSAGEEEKKPQPRGKNNKQREEEERAREEAKKRRFSIAVPTGVILKKSSIDYETAQSFLQIIAKYGDKVIPSLLQLVLHTNHQIHGQNNNPGPSLASHSTSESILDAISAYCSLASPELLNKHFRTALTSAGQTLESLRAKQSSKPGSKALQNDFLRLYDLLDIMLALSSSLGPENCNWLYQLGAQLLNDSDPILQKKAYKILAKLCENHTDWLEKNWQRVESDLSAATVSLTASATKTRIAALRAVVLRVPSMLDQPEMFSSILQKFLGEIILCCKEASNRTREQAFDLLVQLGHELAKAKPSQQQLNQLQLNETSLNSQQPLLGEYLIMLLAGLSGSPHMQSATVLALARLIYEFKASFSQQLMLEIFKLLSPLLKSPSREILKSVIGFMKVAILSIESEKMSAELPVLVNGLANSLEDKKARFKAKIRIILEILFRKFGFDHIKAMMPQKHWPLLEHIKKEKEKERSKKTQAYQQRQSLAKNSKVSVASHQPKENLAEFDEILNETDEEAEEKQAQHNKRVQMKAKRQHQRKNNKEMIIADESLDFLSGSVVNQISTSTKNNQGNSRGSAASRYSNIATDSAGKLVINEALAMEEDKKFGRLDISNPEELRSAEKSLGIDKKKRKKGDEEEEGASERPSQGFKRGGDSKKSGAKFQPYSYVPLDPSQINRRKKFTVQRRMESVVNAAKKGAHQGQTASNKQKHRSINKKQKKHR